MREQSKVILLLAVLLFFAGLSGWYLAGKLEPAPRTVAETAVAAKMAKELGTLQIGDVVILADNETLFVTQLAADRSGVFGATSLPEASGAVWYFIDKVKWRARAIKRVSKECSPGYMAILAPSPDPSTR